MGKSDKQAAIQQHKDARTELARLSAASRDVTPEIVEANRRVIDAEKNVPWYRR